MKLHEYFVISKFVSSSRRQIRAFNLYSPFGVTRTYSERRCLHVNQSLHKTPVDHTDFPVENLVSQLIVMPGTPAIELLRAPFSPEGHAFSVALAKTLALMGHLLMHIRQTSLLPS